MALLDNSHPAIAFGVIRKHFYLLKFQWNCEAACYKRRRRQVKQTDGECSLQFDDFPWRVLHLANSCYVARFLLNIYDLSRSRPFVCMCFGLCFRVAVIYLAREKERVLLIHRACVTCDGQTDNTQY